MTILISAQRNGDDQAVLTCEQLLNDQWVVTSSIQDSFMIEIIGTRYDLFHALGAKRALVLMIFMKCLGASLLHPRNVEHLDNFLSSTNKTATSPCKRRGSQCRLPLADLRCIDLTKEYDQ